jgi:hypothetical protein
MLLLSLLFLVLIGFFLAVMDRTAEEVAFNNSVFRNLDRKWWLRSVSWQYVKFIRWTKYRPDAWHIAKSAMIASIGLAAVSLMYAPVFLLRRPLLNFLSISALLAVIVTASFVVFYDYVLKQKPDGESNAGSADTTGNPT